MTEVTTQFNPNSDDVAFMIGMVRLYGPGQMAFVKPTDKDNMVVWMKSELVHALLMKDPECAARHPDNFCIPKFNDMYFPLTYAGPSSPVDIPNVGFRGSSLMKLAYFNEDPIQIWYYAGASVIPLEMDKHSFATLQELSRYNPDYKIEKVYSADQYPGVHSATRRVFESEYSFYPQQAAFVEHGPHERTTVETEELVTQQTLALIDLDIAALKGRIDKSKEVGAPTYGIPEVTLTDAEKCKEILQLALPAYAILREKGYVNVPEEAYIDIFLRRGDDEVVGTEMAKWLDGIKALPLSTERADLHPKLANE